MKLFQGTYTAIITPFATDTSVDFTAFAKLIDRQIEAGVEGIVILGTTGETPTITTEEHKAITKWSVQHIDGRCTCIIGAGSNSTAEAIDLSQYAQQSGADAVLQSSPYYNKPTAKGMYQHFAAIAEAISIPIMLYEVPGRTSVSISPELVAELAKITNIQGVKAANDMTYQQACIDHTPDDFCVLSGEDDLTFANLQAGGDGSVSVTSNLVPRQWSQMVRHGLAGEFDKAQQLFNTYQRLADHCFLETNPQPVKTALAMMDLCQEHFRLPMTTMKGENKKTLERTLQGLGLV